LISPAGKGVTNQVLDFIWYRLICRTKSGLWHLQTTPFNPDTHTHVQTACKPKGRSFIPEWSNQPLEHKFPISNGRFCSECPWEDTYMENL